MQEVSVSIFTSKTLEELKLHNSQMLAPDLQIALLQLLLSLFTCRLLRERKAEDHLFGDKEKFVTKAYKQKLEEDKKWLEEEAVRERKEEQEDVRKRGHMGDFYRQASSYSS